MTNEQLQVHLEEIRAKNANGLLVPEEVWQAAREEGHPLHDEFPWDVQTAAERHWTELARRLIRRVTVIETVHTVQVTAPKYARDPRLDSSESGYRPITTLRSEEDTAKGVLFDELDRVASTLKRARAVATVLGLHEELEVLMARVGELRQRAETSVVAAP